MFLGNRPSDLLSDGVAGNIHFDSQPGSPQCARNLIRVIVVAICHRNDGGLHRRQPARQGAGIVLDEYRNESLDRTEQRPMDHDRARSRVLGRGITKIEIDRLREIKLDSGQLPTSTDGVSDMDIDLGTVERPFAVSHRKIEIRRAKCVAERLLSLFPKVCLTDPFLRECRQIGLEILKAEVAKDRKHKRQQGRKLTVELIFSAKDVAVVLGKSTSTKQSVHYPRTLVPIHRAKFEKTHGKIAIAPAFRIVDHDVEGAVHRFEAVLSLSVQMHRWVHTIGVELQMSRRLPQFRLRHMRRENHVVPPCQVGTT